jgi:hypothetical protein
MWVPYLSTNGYRWPFVAICSCVLCARNTKLGSHPAKKVYMTEEMSKNRRQLLTQMERLIGNECYNASIQNYGPGGVRESSGRGFRYPVTIRSENGDQKKYKDIQIPSSVPTNEILSGHYKFGSNQLDIMVGLNKILQLLEKHHNLSINRQSPEKETE